MNLLSLFIQSDAIIAEPISAVSGSPFILRYVASGRARAVVVMDAICGWFASFVDGIKGLCCWHGVFSFGEGIIAR
jgi:hypothetical protein